MEKLKNKVMIVDDEENVTIAIEMSLQMRKIETISFNDGEKALEYLKENKVSVILLDYHMEPHINGDEFIKKLREFDNETIVYLQTAYSEELPAMDMLEKYQIQGYIDKGKKDEERMQLIVSALKQAETLELVKEQREEINAHEYKEEFIGRFFDMIFSEVKEKAFAEVGTLEVLKDTNLNKEEHDKFIENLKNEISDINNLLGSLDIEKEILTSEVLKSTLEKLLHIYCQAKSVKLTINVIENKNLNCNSKSIIYIVTDVVDYLIGQDVKEININIKANTERAYVEICNQIKNEEIEKINRLAKFDDNIDIEYSNEILKINC